MAAGLFDKPLSIRWEVNATPSVHSKTNTSTAPPPIHVLWHESYSRADTRLLKRSQLRRMSEPLPVSLERMAAQALGEVDPVSGDLVPAIHMSTTFERQTDGAYLQDRVYARADNPTFEHAERLLAALEGGSGCALFASGMAATTAIFQSLVPGDHVLVARVLYWGVRKWLAEFALTWGLDVEFVDTTDLTAVARAIRTGRTRLIWVETPAN